MSASSVCVSAIKVDASSTLSVRSKARICLVKSVFGSPFFPSSRSQISWKRPARVRSPHRTSTTRTFHWVAAIEYSKRIASPFLPCRPISSTSLSISSTSLSSKCMSATFISTSSPLSSAVPLVGTLAELLEQLFSRHLVATLLELHTAVLVRGCNIRVHRFDTNFTRGKLSGTSSSEGKHKLCPPCFNPNSRSSKRSASPLVKRSCFPSNTAVAVDTSPLLTTSRCTNTFILRLLCHVELTWD
mmetsp:Transcript_35297/g.91747  ORF Transcript_35297/g.91747 Transcript_35297/m.91747 type:complete len:244 (-) Transcript_35297:101-832(-)